MSGRMDTLCLRLADLARAQHAALAAGDLDGALALFSERVGIEMDIKEIQNFDGSGIDRGPIGQSVDGNSGGWNFLSDTNRSTIEEVRSVDGEMTASVQAAMSDITKMLFVISKIKRYADASSALSSRSVNAAVV
jgi:hypothetical protein